MSGSSPPRRLRDPAFTDQSVTVTGLWASTDCTGTQLPLTPAEATSVAGECSDDMGGFGDQSKTVTLAGDTGFFYEVIYTSTDANKKCVGTFSHTKRYALDKCQVVNAGGTLASAKFTKTAPSSDATTAMASLAGVSAVVAVAAALRTAVSTFDRFETRERLFVYARCPRPYCRT